MMSDPVADLLTRIRNASRAEHEKVDIPASRLKVRGMDIVMVTTAGSDEEAKALLTHLGVPFRES